MEEKFEMITQFFNQGDNEIKIEIAESLEDAEKNNFAKGEYSKYYINGQKADSYMSMVKFMINESKNNKKRIIPRNDELMKMREQLFQNQKKSMEEFVAKIKNQHGKMGISADVLEKIDDYVKKLDPTTNARTIK